MAHRRTAPSEDGAHGVSTDSAPELSGRITVEEIARRLDVGRLAVYALLQQGIIPGIRLGRRWIITRHAYESWERTCGTQSGALLGQQPEVKVVN